MKNPRSLFMYMSLIILGFGASIEGKRKKHMLTEVFIDSFICEIVFKIKILNK